ncbi:30S ribosomal protein S8 [Chlamydiales bacterium SCGC AG-110-M15]|nr:30S ribosomal protein S8 [Chlamydiales bacterium SCGC AG-110-M15]
MRPTDSIADLLVRIKTATRAEKLFVDVPKSNMKLAIIKLLCSLGFLTRYVVREDDKQGTIRVYIKYAAGRQPVIHDLKRISRPGRRTFVGHNEIPRVLGGMGTTVLSTSKGIISGDEARKLKVGGELLFKAW